MSKPLNPVLYHRLKEEFGTVNISQEGVAACKRYDNGLFVSENTIRMELDTAGEYYRVNCPYCGDSRGRLWVNHLWGVWDDMIKSHNLWLSICFNENCLSQPERTRQLYNRVYGFKNANLKGKQITILEGTVEDTALKQVLPPGLTIPLTQLAPTSSVIKYLQQRSLDPIILSNLFNVSYCINCDENYRLAQDRLVIPVYMNNMLVGWQCRYVGDVNWKDAKIPKYYTRPTMPKRLILYNYDQAMKFPFVVVNEGPIDVWRTGAFAVAIFGKKPSQPQIKLLCDGWKVIVILLDGDAHKDIDDFKDTLIRTGYSGKVITIKLPDNKDPADFDQSTLLDFIVSAAEADGIKLLDLKRSDYGNTNDGHEKGTGLSDSIERLKKQLSISREVREYSFDMPRDAAART